MEHQEYLNAKNEMYDAIIEYIENENPDNLDFYHIENIIKEQNICESKEETILLLRIIIKICDNHHRGLNFFQKFEKIFQFLFQHITRYLSNSELFQICKNNKWIVLFLIKNKIITVDEEIVQLIFRQTKKTNKYYLFFYPEIMNFLNQQLKIEAKLHINEKNMKVFERKRLIGENDSYISQLIRNDSIDDFVSYIHQTNFYLSSKIKESIYETNSFLIENEPYLIEYAAFYGSLQIFLYLKANNVSLYPSLWLYAIHGKNDEIIHHLENCHVEPPNGNYHSCFHEAIKCHHNDIANYFKNLFNEKEKIDYKPIFKYYNINQIPNEFGDSINFYYLCKYNYSKLVELYIKPRQISMKDDAKVF